jgi:hypothetical protein
LPYFITIYLTKKTAFNMEAVHYQIAFVYLYSF